MTKDRAPEVTALYFNAGLGDVKRVIAQVEAEARGRFYGLENVKANGDNRKWSIASRPPVKALEALKGSTAAPGPDHIIRRYDANKRGWRSIDLSTCKRIWTRDRHGRRVEYIFE